MILDQRHREGLEKLEATYETFLNGSHNLTDTFKDLSNYIMEFQSNAIQSLKPDKIQLYLEALAKSRSRDIVQETFNYVVLVRSKYLLIVTAFYMHRGDFDRVQFEFSSFNEDFRDYTILHEDLFNKKFEPQHLPRKRKLATVMKNDLPDILAKGSSSPRENVNVFLPDERTSFTRGGVNNGHEVHVPVVPLSEDSVVGISPKTKNNWFSSKKIVIIGVIAFIVMGGVFGILFVKERYSYKKQELTQQQQSINEIGKATAAPKPPKSKCFI